jgi:hypothetical protein
MQIVDRKKIHIFCMSGKGTGPHSKVEICTRDTWEVKDLVVAISSVGIGAEEAQTAL